MTFTYDLPLQGHTLPTPNHYTSPYYGNCAWPLASLLTGAETHLYFPLPVFAPVTPLHPPSKSPTSSLTENMATPPGPWNSLFAPSQNDHSLRWWHFITVSLWQGITLPMCHSSLHSLTLMFSAMWVRPLVSLEITLASHELNFLKMKMSVLGCISDKP
jgi:hypothetical protein